MKTPHETSISRSDQMFFVPASMRWAKNCVADACDACPNGPAARAFAMVFTLVLAMLVNLLAPFSGARAQQVTAGLMSNGDLAVTGFSGTKDIGGQTFIDTEGASLKILDVSARGVASGQLVETPAKFQAFARDIGQVFGTALDNAPNPNIYVTATTAHGLKIVIPDNNGDGVPEVVQTGQAGASFMEGQFGSALGGGPGTVWRIDGTTGEITRFTDIASGGLPNSGPGLGNITFDPAHYQFYVSDMDTGNIHRLDLSGNDLGSFDHGTQGRPQAGLGPVGLNVAGRMDITNAAFDSTNPTTWGIADERRRVWGLAYYSGRLFYAVAAGSQIWSVGINTDGSFSGDARVEIDAVDGGKPVSDILFTPQGRMIVAQRGGFQSAADFTLFHVPSDNRVLRYSRDETGNWIQQGDEYAIGFPADHKQASGGVGLACDGTLWSTGDALRNEPAIAGIGPYAVHGLQGNNMSLVRPLNVPPHASWFVDYDNMFSDPEKAGHVGDVEVYRDCSGDRSESWPGWYPIPEWYPPEGWVPPVWWPRTPDLDIEKYAQNCEFLGGFVNTVECKYTIVVTNNGAADWVGHLNVTDNPQANATFIPPAGGSIPWTCAQPGGAGTAIDCQSDNVETLHPGESETLEITIQITNPEEGKLIRNCAVIDDPFDFWLNEDCDEIELPKPDLKIEKIFSNCVPEGANQRCFFFITMENTGGAPYTGALQFEENLPAGTIFGGIFGSTTPGWGCVGGAPVVCTLPDPPGVTMNPGDVEVIGISVIVPPAAAGDLENCVNLGNVVHPDDPVLPGANEHCEAFTSPAGPPPPPPVKHACPAGWQDVPAGGIPAGWQGIVIDGINPDGTGWSKTCMKPKPQKKPEDLKNPPVVHKCPAGWQKVPPQGVPAGWQAIVIDGINPDGTKWGIKCMKPKPQQETFPLPNCRKDEKKFSNSSQIPSGWSRRLVKSGKVAIWCAKPGLTLPLPNCRKDEKKFSNPAQIPSGWSRRTVKLGKVTVWCAKPGLTYPDPVGPKCLTGEKQVSTPSAAPKGWTVRTVSRNGKTIFCAKPGTLIPPKPSCKGGKLVMLKTMPPRWKCVCPQRTKLINGQCKPDYPLSTPEIKPCPKGWSKVRGKCIPPVICQKGWRKVNGKCLPPILKQPKQIICQKGWRKVNGKCLPPILKQPKQIICKKGWRKVNGKCLPPILKLPKQVICKKGWRKVNGKCLPPVVKRLKKSSAAPKRNTGKVMMLAPSRRLR